MSRNLGARDALELLNGLQATVHDCAAAEDRLLREHQTRLTAEKKGFESALAKLAAERSAALEKADAILRTGREHAQARFARRSEVIARASRIAKKQAGDRIEAREGRRKYALQKSLLDASRTREADRARAETTFEEFNRQLAANHEVLVALEDRAARAFRGFRKFRRLLIDPGESPPGSISRAEPLSRSAPPLPSLSPARSGGEGGSAAAAPGEGEVHGEGARVDTAADENQLFTELSGVLDQVGAGLDRFRRFILARVFQHLPLWLLLLLLVIAHVGAVAISRQVGSTVISDGEAGGSLGATLILSLLLYLQGRRRAGPVATAVARGLAQARRLHESCLEKSRTRHDQELERVEREFKNRSDHLNQEWNLTLAEAAKEQAAAPAATDEKVRRVSAMNETRHRAILERLDRDHDALVRQRELEMEARKAEVTAAHEAKQAKIEADHREHWQALEADWKRRLIPIYDAIAAANTAAEKAFPVWSPALCEHWMPPAEFLQAAKFGRWDVDVAKMAGNLPRDPRLALPGPSQFGLPLLLACPRQGSVLFETARSGPGDVVGALNNIILRLLSTAPPGRVSFTILDPVGLGQNFAGVMHLADHAEHLIHSRIWTQSSQIEQRLADLSEHMEKVIQMYLRNEYATIAEYNEQAGNIAEKYHFLVIADFPVNFTDVAAKRLLNIAASGARCGVYTLIHWDRRHPLPQDCVPDELRRSSICVTARGDEWLVTGQPAQGASLTLDPPPAPDLATGLIQEIGERSRDSNRVEVPFSHVAPGDAELWTSDTTAELQVAIGRTGATKLQYLAIGRDTRQHGLIAGKTGSGKSTLFHVIITNLALWCSPDQVEFYLVDFKKGVEFKCYATHRLPHARVVAIESDREFGLSVLQRVDDELRRRGDLFRELEVQDLAGYRKAGGTARVPRSLLIIDEFQEFFVEDDRISQTASVLLDRLVRQGRAFGIHVLLGSQTLGGAYTLARPTIGQMVIRIALQCNEADAYLIMDDSNPAPRLLSRPGEGIYNDTAGTVEGNSPFQTVWLPDDLREIQLARVRERADQDATPHPAPIVFEGNAPADVAENARLSALLEAGRITPTAAPALWLGAPNSIKGPTEAVFHRQSGSHLLIVGQREEAVVGLLSTAFVSLAAQYPPGAARFLLFEGGAGGSSQRDSLELVLPLLPQGVTVVRPGDLADVLPQIVAEFGQRTEGADSGKAPAIFLFIHGLQRFGKLRFEEDFGFATGDAGAARAPGLLLNQVISDGAQLGVHLVVNCDTYANALRFLGRKALGEFAMRVLFQMSANDSAVLIDSPKASTLGLHRALFHNEQEGYLETFRPYAFPRREWLEAAGRNLARLAKSPRSV